MGIFNSSLKNHLDEENPEEKQEENPEEKPQENPEEKPQENPEEKPQENPEEKQEEKSEEFKKIDTNNDDIITWEEFEIEFEKKKGRKMNRNDLWDFLAMDRNSDTSASLKEWNEY